MSRHKIRFSGLDEASQGMTLLIDYTVSLAILPPVHIYSCLHQLVLLLSLT